MFAVDVADTSAVAEARRKTLAAAAPLGLDDVRSGQLAIVATELASNLIKHAGRGELLVDATDDGLMLWALDRGPGMQDVARCLSDGYSSAGTSGNGLGAVKRLASAMHVGSWPGRGTAVVVQMRRDEAPPAAQTPPPRPIGAVCVPKAGEEACGDAWTHGVDDDGDGRTFFVVDGLGHGTAAAVAAQEALRAFHAHRREAVVDILQAVHERLRHTRGAAIAVARVQPRSGVVSFGGVGNIGAALLSMADGGVRRMVSHNGTAGHNARKFQAFEYPYAEGTLLMLSDGIGTSWSVAGYPGAQRLHPALLAGLIYRDFSRGRDDATVVVVPLTRAIR